jgi:hypothetical protein
LDRSANVSRWRQKQRAIPAPYPMLDVCSSGRSANKRKKNQCLASTATRVFYLDVQKAFLKLLLEAFQWVLNWSQAIGFRA